VEQLPGRGGDPIRRQLAHGAVSRCVDHDARICPYRRNEGRKCRGKCRLVHFHNQLALARMEAMAGKRLGGMGEKSHRSREARLVMRLSAPHHRTKASRARLSKMESERRLRLEHAGGPASFTKKYLDGRPTGGSTHAGAGGQVATQEAEDRFDTATGGSKEPRDTCSDDTTSD